MSVQKIEDHVDRALDTLPGMQRNVAEFQAIVSAIVEQAQDIEDALFELFDARIIENATGEILNQLGRIVGVDRTTETDELFRTRIRVQILVNNSQSSVNELLRIAELSLPTIPTADIRLDQFYPASFIIETFNLAVGDAEAAQLARLLALASPAGVDFQMITSHAAATANDANVFTMADAATTLNTAVSAGLTTSIVVEDSSGLPDSGAVNLDEGTTSAERLTYASKDDGTNTLTMGSPGVVLGFAHAAGAGVILDGGPGLGLGSGQFLRVLDG